MSAAWALLRGLPWRLVGYALAVCLVLGLPYCKGRLDERGRWEAKAAAQAAAQAKADADDLATRTREDNKFAAVALAKGRAAQDQLTQLHRSFDAFKKNTPLLVSPPLAAAEPADDRARADAPVARACADGVGAGGSVLSLGAVWLWNSALAGQSVAAHTCQPDATTGQADPSCAEPAGLGLDAAWDNHAANAASCALDRARHRDLIDFLNQRSK